MKVLTVWVRAQTVFVFIKYLAIRKIQVFQ